MKTLTKTFAIALVCLLSFTTVKAQSTNSLEGRARGAAHECLQAYENGTYDITSSTDVTGICFVQGFTYRVTFYAGPKCNGQGPCPAFPTRIIATVDFGCEGAEVMDVTCY